ncbi:hypothetical protein Ccrd_025285 [Cynara cardunculus var. scolymus]|uniref:Uncharacterized protein n=1 Tax=Cynara cardunculus var. scolymus TaxID=59895 RepID=A0A103XDU4_CYNCS|nr:hypothetical protein Ccrd_025285 [Cynara cardunculus var. scolymus]
MTLGSLAAAQTPTFRTVVIPFSELKDKDADLSVKIEEGFGPDGLGILSISDVPGYAFLRKNLLNLAPRYNFGWSHGNEKLESGKPDLLKGSFYANPILDIPTTEASLIQRYPAYLMKEREMLPNEGIEQIVFRSRCHKGLTYGMFTRDGVEMPCPDSTAGLYIKTRTGQIVKAPKGGKAAGLERSTFALFMQPDWDEKLNFPEAGNVHQEANGLLTFGEYTEKLLDKYYHLKI